MKAALVTSLLATLAGCGGLDVACQTTKCSGNSMANGNTYQVCGSLTGTATYKFGSKSCTCTETNQTACENCSVEVGAYCGVTGSPDGGLVYTNSTDMAISPCSITLTGALTGTFSCQNTTVYASGSNLGGPTLTVLSPSPLTGLSVTITRPGMPTDGTWTNTDSGAKGALAASSGAETWLAAAGSSSDQGTYTMNLVLGGTAAVTSGDQYISNGTVSAVLPAVVGTGATGTVNLTASF